MKAIRVLVVVGSRLRTWCGVTLLGLLVVAWLVPAGAQQASVPASSNVIVPPFVRFSGVLRDVKGNPLTGVVGVTFSMYKDSESQVPVWTEVQNVYPDSTGHYSVILGTERGTGLPTDIFISGEGRWLSVRSEGQPEQARVLLLSVPYALKAADAETLGGKPASAYLLNPQQTEGAPASAQSNPAAAGKAPNTDKSAVSASVSGSGTTNYIPLWTSSSNLGNSIVYQSTAGYLGIGTTSPVATLDIREPTGLRAIASGNGVAVYGDATVASGTGKGVEGDSASTSGTGVAGVASATTGFTQGMWGGSYSPNGIGVLGEAHATSGSTIGVEGVTSSTSGIGVEGEGNGIGVEGLSSSSTGTAGVFNNTGGGKILSGQTSGTEVFSVNATGVVTGSSYQIGSNLFAFGSYSNWNAFLGFAGNSTMTGTSNTASGVQALQADTSGYGNTANGYQALQSNTTGYNNTASGGIALDSNTTGYSNTATGYGALERNTTGTYNTATGLSALFYNTTGTANTASGVAALAGNTTGGFNTASGYGALNSNNIGQNNTASGANAMLFNTSGTFNTATGYQALYSNTVGTDNTASGVQALFFNTDGVDNVASGYDAMYLNTHGSSNTAVGQFALFDNITGSNNTALGDSAGGNVSTGSNNIEIGNPGTASDNGVIRIGTAGSQTSALIAGIYGTKTSANNAVQVLIDSNGNLGTISSSRRYKEDIQDMGDASSGLMRLRPVTFRYQKPFADGSKPVQYGLIAEEVAEVYPDLVARSADGQIETVKYQLLDPMLLNEVQRQQAEIRDLQERLSKMEAALAAVSRAPENR